LVLLLASVSIVATQPPTQAVGRACPTGSYLPDTNSFPTDPDASLVGGPYLQSNNLFYKVNKNSGEAVVVNYNRNFTGDLVVPENVSITGSEIAAAGFDSASTDCLAFVKSYKVRFISEQALTSKRNVTAPVLNSVSIEAKIKSIGQYAFQGQCKIDSLVIPDSVTDIGEGAFWYMDSSTAANPNCATSSSHGLKTLTLGVNLQRLHTSVFGSNQRLNTITFRGPVLDVASPGTYPSTYDLWNVSGTGMGRKNNLCWVNFTYVFASLNVLTNSEAGWNSWATFNGCFNGVNLTANITTAPGKVDTPIASNPTQTTADVTFVAPANNGGSPISEFVVTSVPGGVTGTRSGATGGTVTIVGLIPATAYRFEVVAVNASGSSFNSELSNSITTLSLTAPDISLSSVTESATSNSAIAGYAISNTGGPVASYSISPPAGNGLSFNSSTGILTGTPLSAASAVVYTITGTNDAGSDTANFTITVAAAPTSSATPAATPAVYSLKLRITFSERSSKLTWAQKKKLRKAIAIAGPKVISGTVVGYVQRENYAANDKVLSAARAKSVAQFLSANGVKVRLVSMGKGALNSNKTSRQAVLNLRYSK
jgi:outer membrane protein OmpA-like peptidoglycan-associated protein